MDSFSCPKRRLGGPSLTTRLTDGSCKDLARRPVEILESLRANSWVRVWTKCCRLRTSDPASRLIDKAYGLFLCAEKNCLTLLVQEGKPVF